MEGLYLSRLLSRGAVGLIGLAAFLLGIAPASAEDWVRATARPGDFPLAAAGVAATIVTDPADHDVVRIAADDLRRDIGVVTGERAGGGAQVWIGTLGRNAAIDRLAATGRIDVAKLKGAWESFLIVAVNKPVPGVARALVIVGSDRRGTAYGAYELSRAIGVSPWHWWADATPLHRDALYVARGVKRFGPPSVRYRGLFLNDEDWGLIPWAAGSHAPGETPLGPKTYARLFELMLRLKANLLWPAMHKVTRPFNADPANAALADRYAIVMGSSHAEPMLRNNVGEWDAPAADFDYLKNPDGVRRYWDARVASHARYESIWTLGMRGIHDSGMVGPKTIAERRAALERIFADQRAMLDKAGIGDAPQVFTPYKEVLDVYRAGLKVPDDVTLIWPDDNFGYIRHFPDAAERARKGGSGVYYHLSYLGAPLSYLWLSTTPPALIRQEMGRAWDRGARRMWVVNVGDLKPAELGTDYFLKLAWDVEGTRRRPIDDVVADFAAETIDAAQAPRIAAVLRTYHRLNFERRPEHLQYYLPGEKARQSPLTIAQADARLADFAAMEDAVGRIEPLVPTERRDAFFELVGYPVQASAAANRRFFAAEAHDRLRDGDLAEAMRRGAVAREADVAIGALTRRYNREIAGGKWRGMMAVEPADGQWRSYRAIPPILPQSDVVLPHKEPVPAAKETASWTVFSPRAFVAGPGWRRVEGLGRQGLVLGATGMGGVATANVILPAGRWRMLVDLLPTYADRDGDPLRLTLGIDGAQHGLEVARETGSRDWADGVLDNRLSLTVQGELAGGRHSLTVDARDAGVMIEAVRFIAMEDDRVLH
ncbi:glycosyl hydrolase 115 family protein [Sphingobium sp. CR2-8]|uniref:glycosyl hydrolase 115 family protein n=1 Tax=Sphingobium sp. CR2-8 TaxID=1306534 RepID=UPI002DBDC12B|nr:glycosyl hydrolase 115 family protein [Sphingobium sp. CR2-8]MEC3912720.1 glycosyl hydrolase 115 family protein [Sphingobium sp. CR2-8]